MCVGVCRCVHCVCVFLCFCVFVRFCVSVWVFFFVFVCVFFLCVCVSNVRPALQLFLGERERYETEYAIQLYIFK